MIRIIVIPSPKILSPSTAVWVESLLLKVVNIPLMIWEVFITRFAAGKRGEGVLSGNWNHVILPGAHLLLLRVAVLLLVVVPSRITFLIV